MSVNKDDLIVGIDEAGRGPLAGPVFAGAVILNPNHHIPGLADSKVLSEKRREQLFLEIRRHALAWSFGRSTVQEIDEINILQASMLAMKRAVERLKIQPNLALVDGNRCPELACPAIAIIQGDALEPAISAASIVAKVLRDRYMCYLDKKYPQYYFRKHKGYATALHLEALKKHGPAHRIHRLTFAPVASQVYT
jgi:ribonuclease HII